MAFRAVILLLKEFESQPRQRALFVEIERGSSTTVFSSIHTRGGGLGPIIPSSSFRQGRTNI